MPDNPSVSKSKFLAPASGSVRASFFRRYPIQLRIQHRLAAADLVLGLKGPVNPASGMTLNLVEFDRSASYLIEKFERQNFACRSEALRQLVRLWQRALGEWGLAFERVELREPRLRSWVQFPSLSEVLFQVRRRWTEGDVLGSVTLIFSGEEHIDELRRLLRRSQKSSWRDLATEFPAATAVHEISFREWKSEVQASLRVPSS